MFAKPYVAKIRQFAPDKVAELTQSKTPLEREVRFPMKSKRAITVLFNGAGGLLMLLLLSIFHSKWILQKNYSAVKITGNGCREARKRV
jgi:hypothetical protein